MSLVVVDRLGLVHRVFADGRTCSTVRGALQRREVNVKQIHVYKLGACSMCFPSPYDYERMVAERLMGVSR